MNAALLGAIGGALLLCTSAGYVIGYRAAVMQVTPVHAYIQGQQDTIADCREAGRTTISGNVFQCTGEPTQ